MTTEEVFKLVELIEDGICKNVEMWDYEEIMPKVATVLFNRYCSDIDKKEMLSLLKEYKEIEVKQDATT